MRGRRTLVVLGVFVAGLAAGVLLRSSGVVGPRVREAPPLPAPPVPEGQNGLTPQERETFYHLSEGGELYPLDWFLALDVESVAADGALEVRPFMDNIERYGFLSDPKSAGNRYGLPVGVSLGRQKALGIEMIGINCTLCHVGQYQYRSRAVRIDGGPNMVLVNKFLEDLAIETERTFTSPRRLVRFWERVREVRRARRAAAHAGDPDPDAPDEALWRRLIHGFTQNRGLLEAQARALRNVPTLQRSIALSVPEGYGRLDAFGIGRDELFGGIAGNSLPADAPVSLPHIWGLAYTGWLQWGANTNSVMERNIGQALGVGAIADSAYRSTVDIENLHRMEDFAYKLQPPAWPDAFPAVDRARAERGRGLFTKFCAPCHETWDTDGLMRSYQLHALAAVGTDPLTAIGFERNVKTATGEILPFAYAALGLITKIKEEAYRERGLDEPAIAALEQRQIRKGPQWDPTFRATLLDSEKWPDSKGRKVYRSKTLVGIWATPPFLHNGSVPTIYDLLRPAAERPVTFPTGQREYDPVKLGLETDPAKFTLAPGLAPVTLDTRIAGNWNTGHEWPWFYPTLTDEMRFAIIEYLKTHTAPFPLPPAATPGAGGAARTTRTAGPGAPRPGSGGGRPALGLLAVLLGAGLGLALLVRSLGADAARHSSTEAADIAAIAQGILTLQARLAADQDRPLRRGTHAKGRAVRGTFEIFDLMRTVPDRALAARLAQGVFAKPGRYPATIRFANGNSQVRPDHLGDVRACSFSVELPPGIGGPAAARQDFAMNNATIFPINDAHAFAVAIKVAIAPSILKGFRSLRLGDKMAFVRIAALGAMETRPPKQAYQRTRYWSTVPFCHGPVDVIKYSAMPCAGNPAQPLDESPNGLQDEIVRHVTDDAHMSCWDFAIQLLDPARMRHWGRRRDASYWIENASVEWKESQAPFHVVARLTLEAGSVLGEEACEARYIDVTTNSTAASAPLGSINRARWQAEAASRKARLGS